MQWIASWHFVVMKRHFACLNIWSVTFSCEIYYLLEWATCLSLLRNSWNYHKPCHVTCFVLGRIKLVELNSSSCNSLDFIGVRSEIIHLRIFYFVLLQNLSILMKSLPFVLENILQKQNISSAVILTINRKTKWRKIPFHILNPCLHWV